MVLYDRDEGLAHGAITLSDDASRYSRLLVELLTDDSDRISCMVGKTSSGTRFVASCVRWQGVGAKAYAKSRTYAIRGTTINTAYDTQGSTQYYHSGQVDLTTGAATAGDYMRIVRVTAWR